MAHAFTKRLQHEIPSSLEPGFDTPSSLETGLQAKSLATEELLRLKPRENVDAEGLLARHGLSSALRTLVLLFVEGHVRQKLRELTAIYVVLRAQTSSNATEFRDWVKESGEACDKMAATLATWGSIKGIVKLAWPLALGAFTAWFGVKDLWEALGRFDRTSFYLAHGLMLVPGIYIWIFLTSAFDYKRELFLWKFDSAGQAFGTRGANAEVHVYALENDLFNLLRQKKRRERPWEIFFAWVGMALIASIPITGLVRGYKPQWHMLDFY